MINLSDVTIEYERMIPTNKQSPEFYVFCEGNEIFATLTRGDRKMFIERSGHMYFSPPVHIDGQLVETGEIVRFTDELERCGIEDDLQFYQFLKTMGYAGWGIYHENPAWVITSEADPAGIYCETGRFYDAIDKALSLLTNDKYWEELDEWLEFLETGQDCE